MLEAEHLGENAELYALGTLDDLERSRVERHVRTCDDCAKRVGGAETAVLGLIDAETTETPPRFATSFARRSPVWIAAVAAAAFVLGLLPWFVATVHGGSAGAPQQAAVMAMLTGHFAHVPFVPSPQGAPPAKAIYARDGGWLYVIVAAGPQALDVAVVRDGRRTVVASIAAAGIARSAFVQGTGHVESVELLARGVPIASARLAYGQGTRQVR